MQLDGYLERGDLLNSAQFGFRRGRSTSGAIIRLIRLISDGFEDGKFVGSLFCDLSKAFDCVSHKILLGKLQKYRFSQEAVKFFESYLTDRRVQVHIGDSKSDFSTITRGVPQGSILGPTLFILYINDLVDSLPDANCILYADDTTVLTVDKHLSGLINRERDTLLRAEAWFAANDLLLNPEKTQRVVFALRPHSEDSLNSAKFLGVFVDRKLTWDTHTECLAKRMASSVYALRNLARFVSGSVLLTAYHALIHCHIDYALIVWGNASGADRVFGIQRRAIRVLAGLGYREDCRSSFSRLKILTLPSAYILQCMLYVRANLGEYTTHSEVHDYRTRNRDDIYVDFQRLNTSKYGINYDGPRFFNQLPVEIKMLPIKIFKKTVKSNLLKNAYYSIGEFLSGTSDWAPSCSMDGL